MTCTMKPGEHDGSATPGTGSQRDVLHSLPQIQRRVATARRTCLLVNFDGVLAAETDDPCDATVPQATREALVRLSKHTRCFVGVVGNRMVSDLLLRVGLSWLMYAGNSGLAISGPGINFIEPVASSRTGALQVVSQALEQQLSGIGGVIVENRGLTATVHYRRVRSNDLLAVRQITSATVGEAKSGLFETAQEHDALEVRPRVPWSKGLAAQWMIAGSGMPDALPIYLGNDGGGADVFQALNSGITVNVGASLNPAAHYHLSQQQDVGKLLDWLVAALDG